MAKKDNKKDLVESFENTCKTATDFEEANKTEEQLIKDGYVDITEQSTNKNEIDLSLVKDNNNTNNNNNDLFIDKRLERLEKKTDKMFWFGFILFVITYGLMIAISQGLVIK